MTKKKRKTTGRHYSGWRLSEAQKDEIEDEILSDFQSNRVAFYLTGSLKGDWKSAYSCNFSAVCDYVLSPKPVVRAEIGQRPELVDFWFFLDRKKRQEELDALK